MSNPSLSTPEGQPDCAFPLELLLPKKETQQEAFLKTHPEYDGRGIIIAILDTGVDPAMPGMQTTTTGERKLIDCIDCSGAGDVDTSTVKTATDGKVAGLTGRELKIPTEWTNPSGKWHLGVKPIYELYTKSLKDTVRKEKKKENWEPSHQMALADTQRRMARNEEALGGFSDKLSDMLEREDLACQVDFLKKADKFEDNGPVADVLAWHDGNQWLACVDTSFRGRLNLCTPMASFKSSGQFAKLSDRDELTYTFRIDSKGNWVEICVASGSHGSHVANIAAAHYPDEPKKNGLAPGAKVISFCIGDNRLGAMETGTALTRAFNLCAEYGVHVANLSFGEGTHLPDKGRVIGELKKLVAEKNVIFMVSGGNNGPALTTVGAPGGTTSSVIGVGAYLTPEMADPLYGVFNVVKGNLYPWSSRGPAADGWLGVSICAPGAALTGVPRYCRQGAQMMNGTSMSSPNAAGSVACILSALMANKQTWTAYQIRVALENSAKQTDNQEKFSQGQGMIQIADAYEYLRKAGTFLPDTLRDFRVRCSDGARTTRGIYLRETYQTNDVKEFTIQVQPRFKNFSDLAHHIEFEKHFNLKTSHGWITAPETFVATSGQRNFFIQVDPTQVPEGQAAYGEVMAYDARATHLGPIFRVPITIIRPQETDESASVEYNFDAHSGCPVRKFIAVPAGATVAEVKVTSLSKIPGDRFILHKVMLVDNTCYRNTEDYKILGPDHDEWIKHLPVKAGRTIELCLARSWMRGIEKPAKVQMEVKFHGVSRPQEIHLVHEAGSAHFHANIASFRPVEVNPAVQLKTLVVPLKQSSAAKIEPLGPQDVFQPGIQINRLLLTYKLNLLKASEVALELPGMTQYLYESPIDCLLFQVFSATKGYEGAGSTFPDRYVLKLEKGEHLIQAQLRHPDEAFLETLRDVPLHVSIKVASPIALDVYKEAVGAWKRAGSKWAKKVYPAGEQISMYFGSVNDDKLFKPVSLSAGCYLKGELKVFEDTELKAADKTTVYYHFTEYAARTPKGPSMIVLKEKEGKKEQKQEMEDALRDLKISWLEKLKDEAEATQLYTDLLQQHPTHLPLLIVRMKQLLAKGSRSEAETDTLNLIFQQILELCKSDEVQRFMGCRQEQNEESITLKKVMEERKSAIIDVLLAKATLSVDSHLAISTLEIPKIFKNDLYGVNELKAAKEATEEEVKKRTETKAAANPATRAAVDTAYAEVLKYIAPDDTKCLILSAKHAIAHGHSGRALKYLWKAVEDGRGDGKDTGLAEKAAAEICLSLGWVHISNVLKNEYLVRHPPKHRAFQSM